MKKEDLRIVYFGNPEYAVQPLRDLVESGYSVVGVVTNPDGVMRKGKKVSQETPVKTCAKSLGIQTILQPHSLMDPGFLGDLQKLKANLQVVVAFKILPDIVWGMPKFGTINAHASLLPRFRGAAPIERAIMAGETETGVTVFQLKHDVDTGDIIDSVGIEISDTDDAGTISLKLSELSGQMIISALEELQENSKFILSKQGEEPDPKYRVAPKIHLADRIIDWDQPTVKLWNFVRALSPNYGALTKISGKTVKILKVDPEEITKPDIGRPGTIATDKKTWLKFRTRDGYLAVKVLQVEGKKVMTIKEFLNGYARNLL